MKGADTTDIRIRKKETILNFVASLIRVPTKVVRMESRNRKNITVHNTI